MLERLAGFIICNVIVFPSLPTPQKICPVQPDLALSLGFSSTISCPHAALPPSAPLELLQNILPQHLLSDASSWLISGPGLSHVARPHYLKERLFRYVKDLFPREGRTSQGKLPTFFLLATLLGNVELEIHSPRKRSVLWACRIK